MKNIIVSNLPVVSSEKDLFLILLRLTPGLKRIIVPENAETPGRTLTVIIANYITYEHALHALEALKKTNNIFQKKVDACWKEPFTDILGELSFDTRAIYVKNLGFNAGIEEIKGICEEYGNIRKISKFANKAFIEYEGKEARKACEEMNGKRLKSTFWRVFPAKRFDFERFKEKNEKNLTFSKNFLDDFDQQKLLRFAYDGIIDETHMNYQIKAKNINDHAKNVLMGQIEALKIQYASLKRENFDRHHPDKLMSPKKKIHGEERDVAGDWNNNSIGAFVGILEEKKECEEKNNEKNEMKGEN